MNASSKKSDVGFEQLVDRLYQTPTEPDTWPSVLEDIALWADSSFALFLTRRNDNWAGWSLSPGAPAGAAGYITSEAAARSLSTPRLLAADHAGFLTDRDLFTEDEYYSDAIMTEWGNEAGLGHAAATAILVPTGDSLVCQVQRMRGQPFFAPQEVAKLDTLRPHLARAGLLASRWRIERLRAVAEALAMLEIPAAVLDSGGRVLAANALINELKSYLVWRSKDRVALTDRRANVLLDQAVANLGRPAEPAVRSIAAQDDETGSRAVVHLIPATGKSRDFFGGGFGIFVVMPISSKATLDLSLLRGLFDLSPAEAKVAAGIAEGQRLEDIASRNDVVYETVRSQLKSVMAKTGTQRQVEVAALLGKISRFNSSTDLNSNGSN